MLLYNNLHNTVFGSLLIPVIKLCAMVLIYLSVAATTILRSEIGPIIYGMFLVYLIALILVIIPGALMMSTVYNISKKFKRNMEIGMLSVSKWEDEKVLMKMTLKSLPVMKSNIGSFYHMESNAKFTLLDNILRGIAFMLISFK
jgi:hypothetical protein